MTNSKTQIMVGIADYAVADAPTELITNGIGSCVAIALYDRANKVGALAHVLLPHELLSVVQQAPAKSASIVVSRMITRMRELQSSGDIEARLIGGASMFAPLLIPGALSLGSRNITAARAACTAADIPVVGEDVGGDHGRSVTFRLDDGSLLVRSVAKGNVEL